MSRSRKKPPQWSRSAKWNRHKRRLRSQRRSQRRNIIKSNRWMRRASRLMNHLAAWQLRTYKKAVATPMPAGRRYGKSYAAQILALRGITAQAAAEAMGAMSVAMDKIRVVLMNAAPQFDPKVVPSGGTFTVNWGTGPGGMLSYDVTADDMAVSGTQDIGPEASRLIRANRAWDEAVSGLGIHARTRRNMWRPQSSSGESMRQSFARIVHHLNVTQGTPWCLCDNCYSQLAQIVDMVVFHDVWLVGKPYGLAQKYDRLPDSVQERVDNYRKSLEQKIDEFKAVMEPGVLENLSRWVGPTEHHPDYVEPNDYDSAFHIMVYGQEDRIELPHPSTARDLARERAREEPTLTDEQRYWRWYNGIPGGYVDRKYLPRVPVEDGKKWWDQGDDVAPDVVGSVDGWRVFYISQADQRLGISRGLRWVDGDTFPVKYNLRSIAKPRAWKPGENVAECLAPPGGAVSVWGTGADDDPPPYHHEAPHPDCDCGFWAVYWPTIVPKPISSATVLAKVEGYGKVVLGPHGWRAEKARIKGIWILEPDEELRLKASEELQASVAREVLPLLPAFEAQWQVSVVIGWPAAEDIYP